MKRTQQLVSPIILLVSLAFIGCSPKSIPAVGISDGTIVLLKNGITNAAVIVMKQRMSPEVVDYTWIFRTDGKSTFDANDTACLTGVVTNATSIAFGPFNISWSTAGTTGGWLYYPSENRSLEMPWGAYLHYKAFGGAQMAVITERDLHKVDAKDPRWEFKR